MKTPALVILAAGIGSRYGGLKQIDPVGPNGEIILDYSVYDALRAGFGKLVFVIRRAFEAEIRALVEARIPANLPVVYVCQEVDGLPAGYDVPPGRSKPWGTGHAIMVCEPVVNEPFCVINADDFYGAEAYRLMADFLAAEHAPGESAMVGYVLRNTLSEYGHVARGVCRLDDASRLVEVVERTAIVRAGDAARCQTDAGEWLAFSGDEIVSLNFWGFQPSLFAELRTRFRAFLEARGKEPKAEFFIPTVVDELIREGRAAVTVLPTGGSWFGVTYREDKALVQAGIRARIAAGEYPDKLWD